MSADSKRLAKAVLLGGIATETVMAFTTPDALARLFFSMFLGFLVFTYFINFGEPQP